MARVGVPASQVPARMPQTPLTSEPGSLALHGPELEPPPLPSQTQLVVVPLSLESVTVPAVQLPVHEPGVQLGLDKPPQTPLTSEPGSLALHGALEPPYSPSQVQVVRVPLSLEPASMPAVQVPEHEPGVQLGLDKPPQAPLIGAGK